MLLRIIGEEIIFNLHVCSVDYGRDIAIINKYSDELKHHLYRRFAMNQRDDSVVSFRVKLEQRTCYHRT